MIHSCYSAALFSSMSPAPELNTGYIALAEITWEAYDVKKKRCTHEAYAVLMGQNFNHEVKLWPILPVSCRVDSLALGKSYEWLYTGEAALENIRQITLVSINND